MQIGLRIGRSRDCCTDEDNSLSQVACQSEFILLAPHSGPSPCRTCCKAVVGLRMQLSFSSTATGNNTLVAESVKVLLALRSVHFPILLRAVFTHAFCPGRANAGLARPHRLAHAALTWWLHERGGSPLCQRWRCPAGAPWQLFLCRSVVILKHASCKNSMPL